MITPIRVYQYAGEGLEKSYENTEWLVGIKNYKPASDIENINCLERHLLTDEIFIPLTEGNTLVTFDAEQGGLETLSMVIGRIYCIPMGVWHNVLMPKEGKIVLVERPDTSMENSEILPLSESQAALLRLRVARGK